MVMAAISGQGTPIYFCGLQMSHVATSVKFIGDKSEETYDKFSKTGAALFTSPRSPTTMKCVYDKVQNVHPFTLCLTTLQTGPASRLFRADMLKLISTEDRDEPLHERIKWAHESGHKIFEKNLSGGTILVMPTQKLLWGLDPEREKTEQRLFVEMIPILERYSQLMPHPKGECDSWDIRTILHTMESFVTLQLLHPGKYYSKDCWWKCTCPFYFQHAHCRDSLLATMLVNKEAVVPSEFVQALIRDRKKRGRCMRE